VTGISDGDGNSIEFRYNGEGQLQGESVGDGPAITYQRTRTSYGSKIATTDATTGEALESLEYNGDMTLRGQSFEDGTRIDWREREDGLETTVTLSGGDGFTMTESSDGRRSSLTTTTGITSTDEFDDQGRLVRSRVDDGPTLEQSWYADGRLRSAMTDDQASRPFYSRNGELSHLVITTPEQTRDEQPSEYVRVDYDAEGRISGLSDESGDRLMVEYDNLGEPVALRSPRAEVAIRRDAEGRVLQVASTWGLVEQYEYDDSGDGLRRIVMERRTGSHTESAGVEFAEGRVSTIHQPDGGEIRFTYSRDKQAKGLLESVVTSDDLTLHYGYDPAARLAEIEIGESTTPVYRIKYVYDEQDRLKGITYEPRGQIDQPK